MVKVFEGYSGIQLTKYLLMLSGIETTPRTVMWPNEHVRKSNPKGNENNCMHNIPHN